MRLLSPFYFKHLEYGAQFNNYFGWQIPWVYSTVEDELQMIRERAGFTEYSFMSHLVVSGRDAFQFLQRVLSRDLGDYSSGMAIYSLMLDETGQIIEDNIVFWVKDDFFVINGRPRIYGADPIIDLLTSKEPEEWLKMNAQGYDVYMYELNVCLFSIQGPISREILQEAVNIENLSYLTLKQQKLCDIPTLIARVGYSGELGYEIYTWPEHAVELWETIEGLGAKYDIRPYGIQVANIISIEKGYLGRADFYEGSTPLEVGLDWTVGYSKREFIGKNALLQRKKEGIKTKLIGFEVCNPTIIVRDGYSIVNEGVVVGRVTNGAYSPTLSKSLGRGWVESTYAEEGTRLNVVGGNEIAEVRVAKSYRWYDPKGRRVRS